MLAYRILRNQEELFEDKKKHDVEHAVNGLIVMFFEGFVVAGHGYHGRASPKPPTC